MDTLFDLFTIQARDDAPSTPAGRLQRASGQTLAALAIGSLWGAAAGSVTAHLAAANLYKVPMVMLLSAASALPIGLLAWSALARERDAATFLSAQAKALFAAALVMGASAPLVALYTHTSSLAGPIIAYVSVAAALVTSVVAFAGVVLRGADRGQRPRRLAVVAITGVVQLAAALQLNVLAAPILPVPTAFRSGIDGFTHATAPRVESSLPTEQR